MTEKIRVKDVTPVKVEKSSVQITKPSYSARSRIYVRSVQGMFENIRRFFGLIMIGLFAVAPWIQYDGRQAILFNLAEQRFNIFGPINDIYRPVHKLDKSFFMFSV